MLQTLHLSLKPFVAGSALAICGYLFFKTLETRSLSNSFAYLWSDVFTLRNTVTAIPAFLMVRGDHELLYDVQVQHPGVPALRVGRRFRSIDRVLHFGVDPWRITEYLIGYGSITKLLDTIYYLWFFAVLYLGHRLHRNAGQSEIPASVPARLRSYLEHVGHCMRHGALLGRPDLF